MKRIRDQLPLLALVVVGGLAFAQTIVNSGRVFPYAGYLEIDGFPANGLYDLDVGLYTQESGGTACDALSFASVPVAEGRFQVLLDGVSDSCFIGSLLWLELAVAPTGQAPVALSPTGGGRIAIGSVPFATQGSPFTRFFAELVESFRVETGTLEADTNIVSTGGNITANTGNIVATAGNVSAGGTVSGGNLSTSGRLEVTGGVITRGGPIGGAGDLGLYSQVPNNWIRFVTNNGSFAFYPDSGYGTNSVAEVSPAGNLQLDGNLSVGGTSFGSGYVGTYNFNTNYSASTDGFVVAYINADNSGDRCYAVGYVDSVIRAGSSTHFYTPSDVWVPIGSFMMPVKRGSTWQASLVNTSGTCGATLSWMPLAP